MTEALTLGRLPFYKYMAYIVFQRGHSSTRECYKHAVLRGSLANVKTCHHGMKETSGYEAGLIRELVTRGYGSHSLRGKATQNPKAQQKYIPPQALQYTIRCE